MTKTLSDYSDREQARALALDGIFRSVQACVEMGEPLLETLRLAAQKHHGSLITTSRGETFALDLNWGDPKSSSKGSSVRRWWRRWTANKGPLACVRVYNPDNKKKVPNDLLVELNRLSTLPGVRNNSAAIAEIKRRWFAGEHLVPSAGGTGDWREWWKLHHNDKPLPPSAPAFPWSDNLLYKLLPKKESPTKKLGTEGAFAALNVVKHMLRNSGNLPPGKIYTADDAQLEVVCLNSDTGFGSKMTVYVMLEWGTRRVVAYTLRSGDSVIQRDVRNLILRGLRVGGLCAVGPTYVLMERGSLALGPRSIEDFEKFLHGRVIIKQTEMIRGRRWLGATTDSASGNPRGKAVVEVFNKKMHELMKMLPGQRGNNYGVQPANLGFVGHKSRPEKGSVLAHAEEIAALMIASRGALKFETDVLWDFQVDQALFEIFRAYNATRGHQMQGFHHVTQEWDEQIQNWKDTVTC